jgi:hypothetical protein
MEEKNAEQQLIDEIRALRADLRRYAIIAMWLFLGACTCGFILFSNHASESAISGLVALFLLIGFLYLVGLMFQAAFNAKLRRQRERADFAILSGRTSGSNRKP